VIGRSGTGKTTTMLLKMLGIQRTWELHPDVGPKPRQLFVTQSHVLVGKVEEYFKKLLLMGQTSNVTEDSPEEIRMATEGAEEEARLSEQEDELIGHEYNERWGSGLPERYSDLKDEHFPLFVTYAQAWVSSF
jgi:hypothetical protein